MPLWLGAMETTIKDSLRGKSLSTRHVRTSVSSWSPGTSGHCDFMFISYLPGTPRFLPGLRNKSRAWFCISPFPQLGKQTDTVSSSSGSNKSWDALEGRGKRGDGNSPCKTWLWLNSFQLPWNLILLNLNLPPSVTFLEGYELQPFIEV